MAFLNGVDLNTAFGDGQIPMFAFVVYQMMFAIITPALITGAFANRVRFSAYFIFLVVWLILVYFPLVHMIWGGGLLAQWGVRDFAGGIVVHASAGFRRPRLRVFRRTAAGQGPRASQHPPRRPRHRPPLVRLVRVQRGKRASRGPDHGDGFPQHGPRRLLCRRHLADSCLGLRKEAEVPRSSHRDPLRGWPCITPAAGYVTPGAAIIIGILSGLVCYLAITLKNRLHWDDALDVWGVHGVGGVLGILCLGVFGSLAVNPSGFDGALRGGWAFLGRQAAAGFGAAAYSFLIAFAALWVINKITRVHVAEGEEEVGLDTAELGEHAYL